MSKKIVKTKWGDIFDKYLAQGCDYAYAAYKADEWERSAHKSPERSHMIDTEDKPSKAYTNAIVCFKDKLLENKHCLEHLKIDLLTPFPYDQGVRQSSEIRTLAHKVEDELNYELSEYQCSYALVWALREMGIRLEGEVT